MISNQIILSCDASNKSEDCEERRIAAPEVKRANLIKQAKADGWLFIKGKKHLCPLCAELI